ncbi:hypothetical protein [Methylorubrum sp. SB2]|uniref:hypothetical protein n=1 Tax=Methylorubrum subtropicum TaxID=3138812 RepID=UPI00313B0687
MLTTLTIGGLLRGQGKVEALIEAAAACFEDAEIGARDALARGSCVTFAAFQNFGNTPPRRLLPGAGIDLASFVGRPGRVVRGRSGILAPVLEAALEEATDEDGAPMMMLAALRRCHQGGPTLDDLIDRLGQADAATASLSLAADSA